MCRYRLAVIGVQPVHARRLDFRPGGIGELHPKALLQQRLAYGPGDRVGAHDQDTAGLLLHQAQQARQGPGGEALQQHREDDHQEGVGDQRRGLNIAGILQAQGKQRRYRRRHDPARGDPGHQRLLLPAVLAPQGAGPDHHRARQ